MPFNADLSLNEEGFRRNLTHWADDLGIDGVFVAGKQGEFFSMSIDERKRCFDIAVSALEGRAQTHHVLLRPEHGRGDRPSRAMRRNAVPITS